MKQYTFHARTKGFFTKIPKALALLLGLSLLSSNLVIAAEKGTTTSTRIQRVISEQTKSESTTHHEEHSSTHGVGASVGTPTPIKEKIKINSDDTIDLRVKNTLPEFKQYPKSDDTFYRLGQIAKMKEKNLWGTLANDGSVAITPQYKIFKPQKDGVYLAGDKEKNLQYHHLDNTILSPTDLANRQKSLATQKAHEELEQKHNLIEYRRTVKAINAKSLLGALATETLNKGSEKNIDPYGTTYNNVKRGYKDQHGNIIIDAKNDLVYPMTDYGTIVVNKGKSSFVSPTGATIIAADNYKIGQLESNDGLLALGKGETPTYAVFDLTTGSALTGFNYDKIKFIGFNRMVVTMGNKDFLADTTDGKILSALPYNSTVEPFKNTPTTWITDRTGYTIIDNNGHILYKSHGEIQEVGYFKNGVAPAKQNKKWGLIKPDGSWLVKPIYDDIDLL